MGLEALMLPVAAANAGMTIVTMDIKDALEKLGLTEVSQLSSLPSLSAPDAEGNMSEPFAFGDILFNENGYLSQDANGEDAALYVGIQNNGGTEVAFIVYNLLPAWEKDQRINSRIGFQYESKMYIYNVSFVSEEVYTGIQDTRNDKHDTTIFDLSGRREEKVQHGIYIQGGKKVVVK
ncbi:MAG: hypothetical protein IJT48_08715 [Bacteroidaceae bacterium]|nr:hypothetical protein [Bacteroidaceae bacterium]